MDEVTDTVKSADRTLDLFELLAGWGVEMAHTELAASLGIPKSSLTKLLKNLVGRGYIEFSPFTKGYRLGPALMKLSQQAAHTRDLISYAQEILVAITAETKESSALNLLKGDECEVVATVNSAQRLVSHLRMGDLAPLYAVSGGKAILAYLPDAMREEYLRTVQFEAFTPRTIRSVRTLKRELVEIRSKGIAFSMEEFTPGIVGIGVPLLSASGMPLGSLNIAMPAVRYSVDVANRAGEALRNGVKRLQRQYFEQAAIAPVV